MPKHLVFGNEPFLVDKMRKPAQELKLKLRNSICWRQMNLRMWKSVS